MFETIGTAGSGLQTYHTWLDVIANNIANVNDTTTTTGKAFSERYVQASELGNGAGVTATSVSQKSGNGTIMHDPTNPIADAKGNIRRADVDLTRQMGDMIIAQRAFQANANVVDRAKAVYEAAIAIGKGI